MDSHLGGYVTEQRRARRLTPQQLAALVGYRNLAKGANRILALERGEQPDDPPLAKLAAVLVLDPAHLDAESFASARAVDKQLIHVLVWSRREEVGSYPDGRRFARTVAVGEVAGPVTRRRGRGGRGFTFG